ncbi:MAG: glycosyhydrolase, partial [Lactobacillus sp.]|nr:glycosyhydrolase [Lactobacillus sp.]
MKKMAMKGLVLGAMMVGSFVIGQATFADSSIPMYRVYNPYSGEHLYTRSTGERDNLKRYGWR